MYMLEEKKNANKVVVPFQKSSDNGLEKHMVNFVDVIKTRKMSDIRYS